MSAPEKKTRTSSDIQNEYNNLAYKAGHAQYELAERKRNLDLINDTLRSLSVEYNGAKAKEDEVAKAVAKATEDTAKAVAKATEDTAKAEEPKKESQ